ncbi:DMT family transporter [Salmonella enterica]|nr:DMT family transporter [Salmonella enterica]
MNKNKYSTPLLMLATILAGMLSPMQSAVNGQLGHWLQDGNACAVISFASGLVVMFFIIIARKETRQQFASIPTLIKKRKIPLWNWFAGLCGAMVVFSEGASASALGVATFQTALISALLLSGLLCDRFGIGVEEKKYFTPWRIVRRYRHHFCRVATVALNLVYPARYPPLFGRVTRWLAACGEYESRRGNGLHAGVHYMELHRRLLCPGRGAGDTYRIRPCHHPVTRYMVDVSRWSAGSAVHRANGDSGERLRAIDAGRSVNSRPTAWLSAN